MSRKDLHRLDYAAGTSRRWPLRAIIVLLLTAAVLGAVKWGLPLYGQWNYLCLQNRLLSHSLPPTTIVYDDNPTSATALLNRGDDHISFPPAHETVPPTAHRVGAYHPRFLRRATIFGTAAVPQTGIIFLHERRSPSGNTRLVLVPVRVLWMYWEGRWTLVRGFEAGTVFLPATWKPGSTIRKARDSGLFEGSYDTDVRFRYFAGQPDPADPAHFTIVYEMLFSYRDGWERGTIDGWLRDDDLIDMKVRDGPLKERHPDPIDN